MAQSAGPDTVPGTYAHLQAMQARADQLNVTVTEVERDDAWTRLQSLYVELSAHMAELERITWSERPHRVTWCAEQVQTLGASMGEPATTIDLTTRHIEKMKGGPPE